MKVVILLVALFALTQANPGANSKVWRWIPRMPTVTPNLGAATFPKDFIPPKPMPRVPGSKAVPGCGPVPALSKIVSGTEAVPHSYPWQVALYIDNTYFCGGSLISDEWVLTAAHCTTGSLSIEVVLGAHDLTINEPTQVTIVSTGANIITHADYGALLLKNDVALVRLTNPVALTPEIQPVCLPARSTPDVGVGVPLTASGWGITRDGGVFTSPILNEVTNPSIANIDCEAVYGAVVTPATICTDTSVGNKGTCSGDSGGPLFLNDGTQMVTRGVTSFVASAGCESGFPDGFTRTKYYLDWIELNTGIVIDP